MALNPVNHSGGSFFFFLKQTLAPGWPCPFGRDASHTTCWDYKQVCLHLAHLFPFQCTKEKV